MRTGIGIHQLIIHGPDKGKDTKEPNATTKKSPPQKILLIALIRMETPGKMASLSGTVRLSSWPKHISNASQACGDTDPPSPWAAGHSPRELGDSSIWTNVSVLHVPGHVRDPQTAIAMRNCNLLFIIQRARDTEYQVAQFDLFPCLIMTSRPHKQPVNEAATIYRCISGTSKKPSDLPSVILF